MAEEDPQSASEEEVLEAFADFAVPQGSALRRVLLKAYQFARVDVRRTPKKSPTEAHDRGFISVIDQLALFRGIVADGIEGHPGSSSAWLVKWLEGAAIDPQHCLSFAEPERRDRRTIRTVDQPRVAHSLLTKVLPAARDLATATGRKSLHLRHVQFELLSIAPIDWFGPSFTGDQLQRLRLEYAERNATVDADWADAWRARVRAPGPSPKPPPEESVRTLSDAPAADDSLGRRVFAEVLGTRIKTVGATLRGSGDAADSAFILHLDGPWGSGKSSILNFLKADLEREKRPWLVVPFNAWRNQSRKPAWLPLILEVRSAAIWRLTPWSPLIWLVWLWWRLWMDWLPYVLAILLISIAGILAWWAGLTASTGLRDAGEAFKALGAIIATIVSVLALARGFAFGSHRNSEAYLETKSQPFRRIIRLFGWQIWATQRPVAIFIDDLDRCDSGYVIDLLEGIQTSLRAAPIVYVVAGDRKWICSSFEKRYADFCGEIGTPGRPLGYLFLDKVFQLSTSMPRLSLQRQALYWEQLLSLPKSPSAPAPQDEKRDLDKQAVADLAGKTRQEDIQREIDKTKENSKEREAVLGAAAKQTATAEAAQAAEHRLKPLARLLEANPRAMKRLVNAYGLNQARAYLENRKVSVEALARWTIIELRWPLLADYLSCNWPEIADRSLLPDAFPQPIRELLASADVGDVIGHRQDKGRLTLKSLAPILGEPRQKRRPPAA